MAPTPAARGPLAEAERLVRELDELEDYYFEVDKDAKMKAKADRVTEVVDSILQKMPAPPRNQQVKGIFLKGRAASLIPGQEHIAETLLVKVIKLDPTSLRAWNALGEVYWNIKDFKRAQECFEQAIDQCGANSVSLRNLSMVLRAVDGSETSPRSPGNSSRTANFAKALEKAKAAVALDTSDPLNWETLGNAYMGDVFQNARRPAEISRALIAYDKAEAAYEKLGKRNPSLQLNRGAAAKYIEDYDLALRSFRKAHDIGAASAVEESQKIAELTQRVVAQIERKKELKSKCLRDMASGLKSDEEQKAVRDLRSMTEGYSSAAASEKAPLVARVVSVVDRVEVPMIIICCDAFGEFFALSLYNAQPSKVADALVPMKSILRICKPEFKQLSVTLPSGKQLSYPSVRVAFPGDVTVVGSGSLASSMVQSVFAAAAERVEAKQPGVQICAQPDVEAETTVTVEDVHTGADDGRWIAEEDAKQKKEATAAKAKAKLKPSTKSKRRGWQCPFTLKPERKVLRSYSIDKETVTAPSETTDYADEDVLDVASTLENSTPAATPQAQSITESDSEDDDNGYLGQAEEAWSEAEERQPETEAEEPQPEARPDAEEARPEAEKAQVLTQAEAEAEDAQPETEEPQPETDVPAFVEQVAKAVAENEAKVIAEIAIGAPPQKPRWADLEASDSENEDIAVSRLTPRHLLLLSEHLH